MVSERTLKRWRRDALKFKNETRDPTKSELKQCESILRMTQELLDLHLIRKQGE